MTKHTPGPWNVHKGITFQGFHVINPDGLMVAQINPYLEGNEANACLIAAAPELLEVLRGLFRECEMVHKHWGEGSNTKQANSAIATARALISRIEGE